MTVTNRPGRGRGGGAAVGGRRLTGGGLKNAGEGLVVARATGAGARQRLVGAEQQEAYKGLRAAARLPLICLCISAVCLHQLPAAPSAPSGGPHPPSPTWTRCSTPPHLHTREGSAWVFWTRPTGPSGSWEEETDPGGRRLPAPTPHPHRCSIPPERGVDDLQASVSICKHSGLA